MPLLSLAFKKHNRLGANPLFPDIEQVLEIIEVRDVLPGEASNQQLSGVMCDHNWKPNTGHENNETGVLVFAPLCRFHHAVP